MIFTRQIFQFSIEYRIYGFYSVFSKGNNYVFIWKIDITVHTNIKTIKFPKEMKGM